MTGIRTATLAFLTVLAVGCASAPPEPPPPEPPAPQPQIEEPAQISNSLKWTTASEVDNFGFDIYRGDSADGPFEKLTDRPIPGAGTVDVPTKYEYKDETIEPGRPYYYYVESISLQGVREQFTPVIEAPPKGVAAEAGTG